VEVHLGVQKFGRAAGNIRKEIERIEKKLHEEPG